MPRKFNVGTWPLQQMPGNRIPTSKTVKLDPLLTLYTKVNPTRFIDLNTRAKTKKVLVENLGANLRNLRLGNAFSGRTSKAQRTKVKINKLDLLHGHSERHSLKKSEKNERKHLQIKYRIRKLCLKCIKNLHTLIIKKAHTWPVST